MKKTKCKYCGSITYKNAKICYHCLDRLKLVRKLKRTVVNIAIKERGIKSLLRKNGENVNSCVHCGEIIPEGRLSCPKCESECEL